MRIRTPQFIATIAIVCATLGLPDAQAEMGKAPAGATDFYLSVFGGYVYQDGPAVNAYATTATGVQHAFAVQDGGFAGADLGFILGNGVAPFGLDNARIEASFSTNIFDDDKDSRLGASMLNVAATVGYSAAGAAGATQEREVFDGSIALKGEVGQSEVVDLTASLEFFVRNSEDKSRHFVGTVNRGASVDGMYYGMMVALQPEFQFGNGLSFATDLAGGFYVLDADGNFADDTGGGNFISDSRTNVGFRGRLGGALKASLTTAVTVSLFGVVNYWSDTAFADMPGAAAFGDASKVGLEGLTEASAGARLTIALGGN